MKKYLFGLGAMLVGAGLMFVLMHGEVSADSKPEAPEKFVCSGMGDFVNYHGEFEENEFTVWHCRVGNLTCGVSDKSISCVKTKSGLFK